ncbi:MAG: cytidine/deoxycytidylate deaminase family protein [Firmicutes bacterium]|nr:cytidine/deoxycytidylate deaminase family protein [Bacillota bacterium]MCL2255893.1 cytidine/deoxycytidylate deaminase family protein [Bacillota bacterium]
MKKNNQKWDKRFMDMASLVGTWSSCIRRKVGAVIVLDKRILTTGYNGASSGIVSCTEREECIREMKKIKSGTMHEFCYAAHAEQNAIVQAARTGTNIFGATLYCTHQPCGICTRMIINSGIKRIVFKDDYPDEFSRKLLSEANIEICVF